MRTGSNTTTVDYAPMSDSYADASQIEALSGTNEYRDIMESFVASRYMKQLPEAIEDPAQTTEAIRDDYELHGYKERKPLARRLGLHAVANAFRNADKGLAYLMARGISALPRTMSMQQRAERQEELNEKYAVGPNDSWTQRRIKAIKRNQLNLRNTVPVYAVGAYALGRLGMPYAIGAAHNAGGFIADTYADVNDYLNKPRTVTMGDGQDLAANAIDYTPVRHNMNAPTSATVLTMGGHTQGNAVGSGYVASLEAAGVIEAGEKVEPVDWSAQMGAVTGPGAMTMETSDQEGAARLIDAVRDTGGGPVKIVSFSQGTEATLRGLNEIAAQNGGRLPDNMEVILIGTPSGRFGMSNNALVGATSPILNAMGLEIDQPIPPGNVTIRTHVNDVFGNSADQSGAFTGLMAISPGHQVVEENNSVLLYTYQEGSTKYEVWGSPSGMNHPVSQLLEVNGMPVSPELNNLFEAAVPRTPHGEETRYTDVGQTADALGVYLDSQTGGMPIASGAIDAVMNDQVTQEFQSLSNLQMLPDQVAKGDIPGAMNTVNEALETGMSYLENPNKITDMANDALGGAGIPFQLPPLEQILPAAPVAAPAAPTPAAPFQPILEQGMGMINQFMPGAAPAPAFVPPAAPAPAAPGGYAPVGNLFSHAPNAGQYAPVGNIFG